MRRKPLDLINMTLITDVCYFIIFLAMTQRVTWTMVTQVMAYYIIWIKTNVAHIKAKNLYMHI